MTVRDVRLPKIFLSYRREDSADIVGRVYDRLESDFGRGQVFLDIDKIPRGIDFRKHITESITACDVLLAVIGKLWLGKSARQSRLNNDDDFVRVELETALRYNIPIIPVLVSNASMPVPADMPESLRPIAYLNAAVLDSGRDFQAHMQRLIDDIEKFTRSHDQSGKAPSTNRIIRWPRFAIAASVFLLVTAVFVNYLPLGDKVPLNNEEKTVFPTDQQRSDSATEGQALSVFLDETSSSYGLKDQFGSVIVQPLYNTIDDKYPNMFRVKQGDKWGLFIMYPKNWTTP